MQNFLKGNFKTFLLFFALSLLFYGNSIRNSFSFDDSYVTVTNTPEGNAKYVPNNPLVAMGFKGIPKIWKSRYGHGKGSAFDYRPVVTTLFAIEYALFKQSPHVNHFVNVLLYTCLLYVMFLFLVRCLSSHAYKEHFALLSCLLFAAHPLHTEVVDSLKSRDELMTLLFSLICLWSVLRFTEEKKAKFIVVAVIFFFLAAFSKLSAVVLIVLIPLVLFVFEKVKWKTVIVFLGAALFAWMMQSQLKRFMLEEKEVRILYHFENPLATEHLDFIGKLLFALKVFGFYLRLMAWPYPMRFYYGSSMISTDVSFADADIWIGLLSVFAALFFCLKTQNRAAWFGLLFMLITMAPVLNFWRPVAGIVGDRLTFSPSFGFSVFISAVLMHFATKKRLKNDWSFLIGRPVIYGVVFVPLCLIYIWNRNAQWYDELTLFEHDAPHVEKSAGANNLIANKYAEFLYRGGSKFTEEELIQKCWHYYNLSAAADSSVFSALNNAGTIAYRFMGDAALAKVYFEKTLSVESDFPQAHENLADCYLKLGDSTGALFHYRKAIAQNAFQYNSYLRASQILIGQREYHRAAELLTEGNSKFPSSEAILSALAACYRSEKNPEKTLEVWERIYTISPRKTSLDSILHYARVLKDTIVMRKYLGLF